MSQSANALLDTLDAFYQELQGEKQAADSSSTTHPSGHVDDGTQAASEGARSAENSADTKKGEGGKLTVDQNPDKTVNQDAQQDNLGVRSSMTGEDPAVEDAFKADKEDPGTSSPADTHDSEKFGSWDFEKLAEYCTKTSNEILAAIATGEAVGPETKVAAATPAETATETPAETPTGAVSAEAATQKAAEAGYNLAAMLGVTDVSDDARTLQFLASTIKEAEDQASLTGNYLKTLYEAQVADAEKQAAALDDMQRGEDHDAPGDEASGATDVPATGPGDGADATGPIPVEALAALAGGAPDGGTPGGDGVTEAEPAAVPSAVGAGGNEEDALAQLASALMELGISPEELLAAGDKMASADDAEQKQQGQYLQKVAAAVTTYKRSGKFELHEAKSAAERKLRNEMKAYVREATSM